MKNKAVLLVISVSLLLLAYSSVSGATGVVGELADVRGHWAELQIKRAVQQGYVSGYPDGTFRPNMEVSRAEFLRMVVGALQLPYSLGGLPWYQPFVAAADEGGLWDDSDSSLFNQPITRIEIMRVVARGLALDEAYKTYFDAFDRLYHGDLPFVDSREFVEADLPYIALAFGAEVISGYPDATMGLERSATRAEAVVMIENMLAAQRAKPESKLRLQELKAITETGSNASAVSNLFEFANLKQGKLIKIYGAPPIIDGQINYTDEHVLDEDFVIEHPNYTAKLKRLYVMPREGKQSMYVRKFFGTWDVLPEHIVALNHSGYIAAVVDITFKRDMNSVGFTTIKTMLNPPGDPYYEVPSHDEFGMFKMFMPFKKVKQGQTYELALYASYAPEHGYASISFVTENATKGGGYRLFLLPR